MAEILTLNDENWQSAIGDNPALVLFSDGEGLRGDFSTQFRKTAAATNDILFAQINPARNPQVSAQFDIGSKPVMIALYKGEVLARRQRPWGSDVVLTMDLLKNAIKEDQPVSEETPQTNGDLNVIDTPVAVTDQTFQQEVIDYSHELPVLVDFWAEWCGPCRMVAPIMEKLAKEFAGQVRIAKVDTDQNRGLSQAFQIMSIPTIMAFKQGKLVFNQPGAFPEAAFRDLLQQLITLELPEDEPAEETES